MFTLDTAWQPWMDLLTGLLSELDEGERIRLGEPSRLGTPHGLLRQRRSEPTRYVSFIGGPSVVVAECVGSTSFGGEWSMSRETESALEADGWGWPDNGTTRCFRRHAAHGECMWLAESALRALSLLGASPEAIQLDETSARIVTGRH